MKSLAKLVALLVGAVAIILVVCVVRAIMFAEAAQPAATAAPMVIPVDQAAIGRLAEAVRIPTITEFGKPPNLPTFREMHQLLERSFLLVHSKMRREIVDSGTLVFVWRGTDTTLAPVLLMGHMDVVPIEPGTDTLWKHPPFSGDVADGWVWGRGTMDDKINVMGLMEAAEALLANGFQPRRTVIFQFGHAEEGGPAAARRVAELFDKRGLRPWFVLDEGGAVGEGQVPGVAGRVGLVGVAEKGYLSLKLTAHGDGGHSSMPPRETAVSILGDAVAEVQESRLPARLDGATRAMLDAVGPSMSFGRRVVMANLWLFSPVVTRMMANDRSGSAMVRTTTAATMVSGGVKDNVVPTTATAIVNFRLLPGDSVAWVVSRVKAMVSDLNVTVEALPGMAVEATRVSPDTTDAFRLIATVIRESFGTQVVAPYLVVGGTDSRNFERVSPNVYRFAPILVTKETVGLIHATNERVGVDNYLAAIGFYRRLIESAAR